VGQTSVSWENGKPVVTFPIPAVPGETATAVLDAKFMTERVVVKLGPSTTEGASVRDLTTTQTETGNVYVVAPVPASVQAAIKPAGQIPRGIVAKDKPPVDKSIPTPGLGGHPDLTGNWTYTNWMATT
jgi:hypothetical protein